MGLSKLVTEKAVLYLGLSAMAADAKYSELFRWDESMFKCC